MKVTKILAILLRVGCRLWSQVGYSGQKAKIFTIDVLLRVVCVEIDIGKILSYCVKVQCRPSFSKEIKLELHPDWSP